MKLKPRYIYIDMNGKPQPVIDICSWSASLNHPQVDKKILKKLDKAKLMNQLTRSYLKNRDGKIRVWQDAKN